VFNSRSQQPIRTAEQTRAEMTAFCVREAADYQGKPIDSYIAAVRCRKEPSEPLFFSTNS
jgi:hypothetical protein